MADINRNDWEKALDAAAVRAADSDYETAKAMGAFPNNPELLEKRREEAFVKYRNELESKMPFDGATGADLDELDAFKSENLRLWLGGRGPGPKETAKAVEASKFLPILSGVAEQGKDWMTMGSPALKEYALSLGYKPGTPEGFDEFLKKVGEYQQEYDRAQVTKEMRESPWYTVGTMFAPSATKAIENAAATGEELTPENVAALTALDVGANSLMATAPGLNVLKASPVLNAYLNAMVGQGGAEFARQQLANVINPSVTPDNDMVKAAVMAGATRPAMLTTAASLASRSTGKAAMDFSRGVMRSSRAGDPVLNESNGIVRDVELFNKMKKGGQLSGGKNGATREIVVDLATAEKYDRANNVRELAKTFNVKPEADGTFSAKKILDAYNKNFKTVREISDDAVTTPKVPMSSVGSSEILLTPVNEGNYARFAGQKIADAKGRSPWRTAGYGVGTILGEYGGRIEPIIKGNPTNLLNGETPVKPTDYKNTTWYKKIQKKSPESAKILDAAFKKKDEEE